MSSSKDLKDQAAATSGHVADFAARADAAGEQAADTVKDLSEPLRDKTMGNPDKALGHPIHPATVHWPLAVSPLTLSLVR